MSLEKVNRDQIPTGARILSRKEVIEEYWKIVTNWKPATDTYGIRYGIPALAGASFLANMSLLMHYRRRLKLGRKAFVLMATTCAVTPSMFSPALHIYYVTNNLFMDRLCPVCAQTRAMFIQIFCSFSYSMTVSPLLCFMKAQSFATFNVPGYYTKEGRAKSWEMYKKITKRASTKLYLLLLVNTITPTCVTAFEMKNIATINDKMFKKEQEVVKLQQQLSS